jgi:hypothetical protein
MNTYSGLIALAWAYRILSVLVALGTIALTLMGLQTAATFARVMAERGLVAEAYNPFPALIAGLLLALALYTAGALLALLIDMAIAQRETADTLARIRGKR